MTSPSTDTTSTWFGSHAPEVARLYQQGIITGSLGAVTVALWFLLLDTLAGRPLYTPHVLGTAFFTGAAGLDLATPVEVSVGRVIAFTGIHWGVFLMIGVLASRLLDAAEHNPNLGFGVLLLFVLFEGGFFAVAFLFAEPVLQALAWQSVVVGNLLAALAMGGYLWRRHPHMVMYP